MKLEYSEGDYGAHFVLTPETLEETATLLRIGKSAKREPVDFTVRFDKDISATVYIKKVKPETQRNYIKTGK